MFKDYIVGLILSLGTLIFIDYFQFYEIRDLDIIIISLCVAWWYCFLLSPEN